ncbi:hypothetical protein FN846DRAFT_167091 [Sphaerosporella brunnea]|uniref:Uncharacterized protein n=1 Tax=Sphaerosporella brunnea TaxID=1250544 RepID=A0A5J5EQ22_9PEZI|nr:hypothetical protein FN846DRAFT_167091 [Sphaerosporella brunnea]
MYSSLSSFTSPSGHEASLRFFCFAESKKIELKELCTENGIGWYASQERLQMGGEPRTTYLFTQQQLQQQIRKTNHYLQRSQSESCQKKQREKKEASHPLRLLYTVPPSFLFPIPRLGDSRSAQANCIEIEATNPTNQQGRSASSSVACCCCKGDRSTTCALGVNYSSCGCSTSSQTKPHRQNSVDQKKDNRPLLLSSSSSDIIELSIGTNAPQPHRAQ